MKKLQIVKCGVMPVAEIECEFIMPSDGYLYAMNKDTEIVGAFQLGTFERAILKDYDLTGEKHERN